jgi:hypothetical protein
MPRLTKGSKEAMITIRLSRTTFERIQARAGEQNLSTVEWCRDVLYGALGYDPDLLILLREIVATRRETRALLKELIQHGELSTERFHFLMNESEAKKDALAEKVLERARRSLNRLPPSGEEL